MKTIEQYEIESENERGGWRGLVGKALTFAGFILFANAFIVALLFRHLLSFRNQVIFAIAGGAIGVLGMIVRGNKRELIEPAVCAVVAGIIATIAINLLEERFGFIVMCAVGLAFAWLVSLFVNRMNEKL
jgi:hypothetical protein